MKKLLASTAIFESITGLLLVTFPSQLTSLLLGSTLDSPAALTIARIAGVALMTFAIVCWMARNESHGSAVKGLITGLIVYNIGVIAVLAYAEIGLFLSGIGLWLVGLVHFVLAIWCGLSLLDLSKRSIRI
jgi:hypothetical protein